MRPRRRLMASPCRPTADELDRFRPDLAAVDPQHHAIGERPRNRFEPQLQPAGSLATSATNEPSRAKVIVTCVCSRSCAEAASPAQPQQHERIRTRRSAQNSQSRRLSLSACSAGSAFDRRRHGGIIRPMTTLFLLLACCRRRSRRPPKVEIVSVTGCLKEAAPNTLDADQRHRSGAEQRERAAGRRTSRRRRRPARTRSG